MKRLIMDTYSVQKAVSRPSEAPRINMIGPWLAGRFGKKMVKLSLPGGTTCPNRDGTCGTGGCLFCSAGGSGENASDINGQIALLSPKWKNAGYLAYFQSFTATYGPIEELREKFYGALADPRIEGIAIATRPDCLGDEVLDLLAEIASSHFLWVVGALFVFFLLIPPPGGVSKAGGGAAPSHTFPFFF